MIIYLAKHLSNYVRLIIYVRLWLGYIRLWLDWVMLGLARLASVILGFYILLPKSYAFHPRFFQDCHITAFNQATDFLH